MFSPYVRIQQCSMYSLRDEHSCEASSGDAKSPSASVKFPPQSRIKSHTNIFWLYYGLELDCNHERIKMNDVETRSCSR